jgi:hypothetical protein
VFSHDERRCGLLTVRRRRLPARGVQPIGTIHHVGAGFYVDGAVAPTTGESCFFELPQRTRITVQVVLDECARAFPDTLQLRVLGTRGGQTAKHLCLPEHIRLVWLPPSRPELTPSERVWRDVQDGLGWQQFTHVEAQQEYVADLRCAYDAPTLQSLTAYSYFVDAVNALSP